MVWAGVGVSRSQANTAVKMATVSDLECHFREYVERIKIKQVFKVCVFYLFFIISLRLDAPVDA